MKLCLADTWVGKTPALLIALRGQEELYCQALGIFQENNIFCLTTQKRLQAFKTMPESSLSNIRKISISMRLVNNRLSATFIKLPLGKY
jgi:hypothetical protein